MHGIYLNIGSNKGDRTANIERAAALVASHPVFASGRIRCAPLEYSRPEGYVSDAEFVNLGLAVDFADDVALPDPFAVLDATQAIEREIAPDSPHRNPDGTYRDRVVDIDIIAIDGVTMHTDRLTLPHPRAAARRFVSRPMAFLAPGVRLDVTSDGARRHDKKSMAALGRDTVAAFKAKPKLPVAVVLDNIRSLNNTGSIFRTADAFRVGLVALCGITGTPPAPEIHKTALGAEEAVDWRHFDTTIEAVDALRAAGYTILCLEQVHDSVSLERFVPDSGRKYALVVGNEVSGVDQAVVDACDVCIEIPQEGTKHSLNVAVSASIAMWHLFSSLKSPKTQNSQNIL